MRGTCSVCAVVCVRIRSIHRTRASFGRKTYTARSTTPGKIVVCLLRSTTPGKIVVCLLRSTTPGKIVVCLLRSTTPGKIVVCLLRSTTPGKIVVCLLRSTTPGKIVVCLLRSTTPGKIVVCLLRSTTPGKIVVCLLRSTTPGKIVVCLLRSTTPGKIVVCLLRSTTPGKIVVCLLRSTTPGKIVVCLLAPCYCESDVPGENRHLFYTSSSSRAIAIIMRSPQIVMDLSPVTCAYTFSPKLSICLMHECSICCSVSPFVVPGSCASEILLSMRPSFILPISPHHFQPFLNDHQTIRYILNISYCLVECERCHN